MPRAYKQQTSFKCEPCRSKKYRGCFTNGVPSTEGVQSLPCDRCVKGKRPCGPRLAPARVRSRQFRASNGNTLNAAMTDSSLPSSLNGIPSDTSAAGPSLSYEPPQDLFELSSVFQRSVGDGWNDYVQFDLDTHEDDVNATATSVFGYSIESPTSQQRDDIDRNRTTRGYSALSQRPATTIIDVSVQSAAGRSSGMSNDSHWSRRCSLIYSQPFSGRKRNMSTYILEDRVIRIWGDSIQFHKTGEASLLFSRGVAYFFRSLCQEMADKVCDDTLTVSL